MMLAYPQSSTALLDRETDIEVNRAAVSVIVPTRNESGNVEHLTDRLARSMGRLGQRWEAIFVDDSDEGDPTPEVVQRVGEHRPEVRCIHRPRRRRTGGLAGAVATGFRAARGDVMVVMDADLQHPPEMAKDLAAAVLSGRYDLAVGSRYVPGASAAGLDGFWRRFVSRICVALVHLLIPATRGVRDPMSGFFALSRSSTRNVRLRPQGFKILLEVLARTKVKRVGEVPFRMAPREDGDSKAGAREGLRFLRHLARLTAPRPASVGRAIRWLILQAPLAAILAVQAYLSHALIYRNTAFIDEATYISAGQYQLHQWAHGGAQERFATFFSGAPTIYPVLAGLADDAGGLTAARYLSLAFMLVATLLCFLSAKRLWGRLAGWFAAAVFVTTQGVQFLGAFATFDSMALMLTALAAYTVIRFAPSAAQHSRIYLAIPVMVLADATKYASALFDLPIIAIAFFLLWSDHGLRAAVRGAATLTAGLLAAIAALLGIASPEYLTGLLSTTVNRPPSNSPPAVVLHSAWSWVGVIGIVALVAAAVAATLAWRRRSGPPLVGLLGVLALSVVLAPANQARIHTSTSLSKHVTFGAWFGAVAAGWLASQLAGRQRRPVRSWVLGGAVATASTCALVPVAVAGTHQARHLYSEWPNSTPLVNALRPLVGDPHRQVVMDDAEVGRYYLERELSLPHWIDTFYYSYTPPGSHVRLVGIPAYRAAVFNGQFSAIALDWGQQKNVDQAIALAVHDSGRYAWVGDITSYDAYGPGTYVVWRLKPGPAGPQTGAHQ